MAKKRKDIPASLQRKLFIEAGFRCAVCKEAEPLEIEHIEEYAKVLKHEFHNMIVLCRNCHGKKRKKAAPRRLDKKNLKKLKSDLALLNSRYSSLEKRILEYFCDMARQYPGKNFTLHVSETDYLSICYLVKDKLLNVEKLSGGIAIGSPQGVITNDRLSLSLTKEGKTFVEQLLSVA